MLTINNELLKQLRLNKGLKQIEAAKELKIANNVLSEYESGKRIPSRLTTARLAKFYEVELIELYKFDEVL